MNFLENFIYLKVYCLELAPERCSDVLLMTSYVSNKGHLMILRLMRLLLVKRILAYVHWLKINV